MRRRYLLSGFYFNLRLCLLLNLLLSGMLYFQLDVCANIIQNLHVQAIFCVMLMLSQTNFLEFIIEIMNFLLFEVWDISNEIKTLYLH